MVVARIPNLARGRAGANRLYRARAAVRRKTTAGWEVVASGVPCSLRQVYREAASGDPVGASSLSRVFWRLGVAPGCDVRRGDEVTVTLPADQGGGTVGPLILGRVDAHGTAVERVCWASIDETATERHWVTLERYDQRSDATVTLGPAPVQLIVDQQRPLQPGTAGAASRWARGFLVGGADFTPALGDLVRGLPLGGMVVVEEVRPRVSDRIEARIRWDEGALP